ncbi:hypothetical protein B0H10DRAFT_1729045, partial [Mycena sp. CBHHK59/15]
VLGVIKSMARTVGVTLEGNISKRSVGQVVLEGGIISQAQVIHKVQHAGANHLFNSKFLNYTTTLYGDANIPATHVNRFIGITNAVNHTADTQVLCWKEVNHEIHEIYNAVEDGPFHNATVGIDNLIDPDTLPAKITGMNSDHVSD